MIRTLSGPQGGRIVLDGREVVNMASNNYLGLAAHPEVVEAAERALKRYGVGPGAGRTVAGNFEVHNELERALARFRGTEDAVVFHSGLAANLGLIPVLVGKDDAIFSDELNHASIIDGCRLSRATVRSYRHLDMASLEAQLRLHAEGEKPGSKKLIVTDGVFSMDGDLAPLDSLAGLAEKYGALLMVDDAHGDGVMGRGGRGTVEHFGVGDFVTAETGSLSKAFGTCGGFAAGKKELMDRVRTQARAYIFTSSVLPPSIAAATLKALEIIERGDELIRKLWENRQYFVSALRASNFEIGDSKTPVVPIILGDEERAREMSRLLFESGVFAQSLEFPVVPRGRARLRLMVSAAHTREDLDFTVAALKKNYEIIKEMM